MSDLPPPETVAAAMTDRCDEWLDVLQSFVRTPSVNPPGDTRDVARVLIDVLDDNGVPYEVIAPKERMPNIVAQFDGKARGDGPHLTFNGHLDTYEVGERDRWERDPFSGDIEDGKVFGRGVSDMHGGFVATLAAAVYLFERRDQFAGRVTLVGVSDEETGGRWGTEYLVENLPEYTGDAVLNGEPSSGLVRFAERGPLWLDVDVRGQSAHSALPAGTSATEVLVEFLHDLRADDSFAALADVPDVVRTPVEAGQEEMDSHYGTGATEFSLTPSMNVGTLEGGGTVNLTAERAHAEVDLRLPVGTATADVLAWVEALAHNRSASISIEPFCRHEPTYTDPTHPLVRSLRRNAGLVQERDDLPALTCGHGFTDVRFYRAAGVPGAYYGPRPYNMGSQNEYITIDDFVETMQVHAATAVEFFDDASATHG